MRMYGLFEELTKIIFRSNTRKVEVTPASQTTGDSVITVPDMAGTTQQMVLSAQAQTLTNKTIDSDNNTITNIVDADIKAAAAINATKIADGSVDNTEFQRLGTAGTAGAGNLVTTDGTQTLTNKTLTDSTTLFQDESDNTKKLAFQLSGITTGNTRTLTIPDASTTIVGTDNTAILTNKTIDGDNNTVQDLALTSLKTNLTDASKFLVRDASGIVISNTKAVPTGAVVGDTDSQTLSSKTLASPLVTGTLDVNAQGPLRLFDADSTNFAAIRAPAVIGTNYTLTLPADDGNSGDVLSTDGSGVLSWTAPLVNPMDSTGDLIVGGASGAATKLDSGAAGTVLNNVSANTVSWELAPVAAHGWQSTDTVTSNRTIASGNTLIHPNLIVDTGVTWTVTGSLFAPGNAVAGPGTLAGAGTVFSS